MDIQKTTEIPEVQKTIVMLRNLSADEQTKREAFYREKRLHDEASAINGAKEEARAEMKNELIEYWRQSGFTDEQISRLLPP